jgi:hypothetical protein
VARRYNTMVRFHKIRISRKDHRGTSDQRNLQNAPLQSGWGYDFGETVKVRVVRVLLIVSSVKGNADPDMFSLFFDNRVGLRIVM